MVRALALRSGDPGFKTRSDHSLNLILVVPGSTSQLHLKIANWFAPGRCCSVPSFRNVSLALKSPYGERSIKYVLYCIACGILQENRVTMSAKVLACRLPGG